jgi:NAD(P)-dependent dehydrogenase (short-subunit alcohol dehydrogenase family)
MTQDGKTDAQWREIKAGFAKVAIAGRVGEPEDIANIVTFFASPELGWITAQVLTGAECSTWSPC